MKSTAWMDEALCAQIGGDMFFADGSDTSDTRLARETCARCRVRAQCLEWALLVEPTDAHHTFGTYGGVAAKPRSRMRRSA